MDILDITSATGLDMLKPISNIKKEQVEIRTHGKNLTQKYKTQIGNDAKIIFEYMEKPEPKCSQSDYSIWEDVPKVSKSTFTFFIQYIVPNRW